MVVARRLLGGKEREERRRGGISNQHPNELRARPEIKIADFANVQTTSERAHRTMEALLPTSIPVLALTVYRFVPATAHSVGIIKSNGAHAEARNNFQREKSEPQFCVLYFYMDD